MHSPQAAVPQWGRGRTCPPGDRCQPAGGSCTTPKPSSEELRDCELLFGKVLSSNHRARLKETPRRGSPPMAKAFLNRNVAGWGAGWAEAWALALSRLYQVPQLCCLSKGSDLGWRPGRVTRITRDCGGVGKGAAPQQVPGQSYRQLSGASGHCTAVPKAIWSPRPGGRTTAARNWVFRGCV